MLRLKVLLTGLFLVVGLGIVQPIRADTPKPINISVVIQTNQVTKAEVQKAVEAIQIQMDRDYSPYWNYRVHISVAETFGDVTRNSPYLVFLQDETPAIQAGVLGFHDNVIVPYAIVFVKTAGNHWTVTMSHEILEMVEDPNTDLFVIHKDDKGNGHFVALEIADPVEATFYAINGVNVSNFVLPAFYRDGSEGPYDMGRMLDKPFQRVHLIGRVEEITIVQP